MAESMFELTAQQQEIRERARAVADAVAPYANEADEYTHVHPEVARVLRESGLTRHVVEGTYGGSSPALDPLAIALIREQFMGSSAHLDSLFGMQGVGSYSLSVGGSDALKHEWLPKVAQLEAIPSLGLTEPDVGSDLRAITTTLREEGDTIIVDGVKSFITNAPAADFCCVLAREGEGYSMVLVPMDAAGVSVESGPDLMAPHILGTVRFDSVQVPAVNRLGLPGKAFSLMLQTLAVFRVTVAASGVGLAQAALDEALRHTRERQQFGKPLAELGAVSQSLALSLSEIEASRAFVYQVAARAAIDPLGNLDFASMAKVQATEMAGRVVDRSLQSMGRFGVVRGSKIERLYRNARPLRIYEGATEVLLDAIARRLRREG